MRIKNKILVTLLCFSALISLILPIKTLFMGEGFLAWQIRQPQTVSMAAEVVAVFLILAACLTAIKDRKKKVAAAAVCCVIVCWLHVTFLPMLLSGLYVGLLLLLGRFFRTATAGHREEDCLGGLPADFLLGSGLTIGLFCLLSAAGIGSIPVLKAVMAALGMIVYGAAFYKYRRKRMKMSGERGGQGKEQGKDSRRGSCAGEDCDREYSAGADCDREGGAMADCGRKSSAGVGSRKNGNEGLRVRLIPAVLIALILTLLLIQVGKMNLAIDFDTLWYGVRSEYILDNGRGIYENPGLVGMVYVYSKGLEVLTLPLCDLASHGYLQFFNVWLAALGLYLCYGIARFFMGKRYALLSAALVAALPAVLNMSISVKPDSITWVIQLIMIFYLLCYLREMARREPDKRESGSRGEPVNGESGSRGEPANGESGSRGERRNRNRATPYLILAAGAYLLSLTMKPTSLVFSTAVFGMAGLYLIGSRRITFRGPLRRWLLLVPEALALVGIWARTMLITGMPVTSVFTSIFALMGFQIKYPFATGSLPQNWQEESNLHVLARRLYQILLAPEGKDMSHVIIAWGTSLLFFLIICLIVAELVQVGRCAGRRIGRRAGVCVDSPLRVAAHVIFWPFLAVNLVSLVMLYQVDGNYFLLLYTMVVLAACAALAKLVRTGDSAVRRTCLALLVPVTAFSVLIAMMTNWAWTLGFSDIQVWNKGRVNHEALQHEAMIQKGNAEIWNILSEDPRTRVIAFGDHPSCLAFPCNVQSYKDVTSPWGNVELVNSAKAFEEYMAYAGTDYVYVEAGHIGEHSWSWSYGLVKEMLSDGTLTDLVLEGGNVLARVDLERTAAKTPAGADGSQARTEAENNLRLFNEHYRVSYEKTE